MKLYNLDGADIDEVFRTLEELDVKKKEVKKEVREEKKEKGLSYKFSLRGC